MAKKKEKGSLAIPYAVLRSDPNTPILLQASGVIQSGAVFYDEHLHKGKDKDGRTLLTCPKCEQPDVLAKKASKTKGDKQVRRDHYARYPEQPHADFCEWLYREDEHGPPREINYAKGAYFYLNTGKLPNRPPYRDVFKGVSSRIPKNVTLLSAWINSIKREENKHGYDVIANDDFKDRPRLNGISNVKDYLKLLHTIPLHKMKDTWVINNDVAVKLHRAIIRIGNSSFIPRTPDDILAHKKAAGLSPSFLMASDPNFDRFTALIDSERDKIKHPVLLHFKVDAKPQREIRNGETFWTVKLRSFKVENPEKKKPYPDQLALPEVTVYSYVHIYDPNIVKDLKVGAEFFAIAHPNLSVAREETPNRTYHQHFNVMHTSDITQMTQRELAESLKKSAANRVAHTQKTSKDLPIQQLIPA